MLNFVKNWGKSSWSLWTVLYPCPQLDVSLLAAVFADPLGVLQSYRLKGALTNRLGSHKLHLFTITWTWLLLSEESVPPAQHTSPDRGWALLNALECLEVIESKFCCRINYRKSFPEAIICFLEQSQKVNHTIHYRSTKLVLYTCSVDFHIDVPLIFRVFKYLLSAHMNLELSAKFWFTEILKCYLTKLGFMGVIIRVIVRVWKSELSCSACRSLENLSVEF